jgi:superfamily II DNA/RNA helicase
MSWGILIQFHFRLKQRWIEVTHETQVDELIKAVNQGFISKAVECRTMVFANTVEAVEAVANILLKAGIHCYRYHKDISLEERSQSLADLKEKGGILVCTDAASRGVDIPNVSHVIQVFLFYEISYSYVSGSHFNKQKALIILGFIK